MSAKSVFKASLLALAFIFLLALRSHACSCMPVDTARAIEEANVIFLGTCMDITTNPIKGGLNVVFQVDSSWKRGIEHVTTVHTESSSAACGYPFQKGVRYLVFATKLHQTIATGLCQPNSPAAEAGGMLARLGPGQGSGRPELESKMNWLLIGLGAAGLIFVALIVLRKRMFRR